MVTKNEFDDIEMLLPFYVNGTLSAEDCTRVDTAMSVSGAVRKALAAIGNLAQTIKSGGREIMQDAGNGEARLDIILNQIGDPQPQTAQKLMDQPEPQAEKQGIGALLRFLNPKRWHPAVSLALVAVAVAQGTAISNLSVDKEASGSQIASLQKRVGDLEFELASGPGGELRGNIIAEVKADAPWSAVEALFGKEGLSIVGGPSDGAITLSSDAKDAELTTQIERLRASPLIASADKSA